jgi:hypothetical protein
MASVLLRATGLDALDSDPEPEVASFERPNRALGEAKGVPLSVRMAAGSPKSLKVLSKTEKTNSDRVDESPSQARR